MTSTVLRHTILKRLLLFSLGPLSMFAMPTVTRAESKTHFNLGLEGGFSTENSNLALGGHISLRASLVEVDWNHYATDPIELPTDWVGGYIRLEQNSLDRRAVLGMGSSLNSAVLGLEGGLLVRQTELGHIDPGAELAAVFTLGPIGLYLRESYVHSDQASWQTDIGIRAMLPMWPGLLQYKE